MSEPFTVLTPDQAAAALGLSRAKIVLMCAGGDMPNARKVGRQWRIPSWALSDGVDLHLKRCRSAGVKTFVYAIAGSGLVKLGFSQHVGRRHYTMQRYSPVPLSVLWSAPGDREFEMFLHARFASLRAHGEWFRHEGELAELLTKLGGQS